MFGRFALVVLLWLPPVGQATTPQLLSAHAPTDEVKPGLLPSTPAVEPHELQATVGQVLQFMFDTSTSRSPPDHMNVVGWLNVNVVQPEVGAVKDA